MKRIAKAAALALVLFIIATPASARLYLGVDVLRWDFEADADREYDGLGLRFNAGMPVNRNLYLESRLTFGDDDEVDNVERELDWAISTFVRPNLPLSQDANLYALVGVSGINMPVNDGDDAELQPSFGAGFDVRTGRRLFVGAEYLVYSFKSDFELETISVNFRWHFD